MLGSTASPGVQSGAAELVRGLTRGEQSYDTDESVWPVSQPRQKVEGVWQTSGEIKYTADLPAKEGELHAAFILTSRANCEIVTVDATDALVSTGCAELLSL